MIQGGDKRFSVVQSRHCARADSTAGNVLNLGPSSQSVIQNRRPEVSSAI